VEQFDDKEYVNNLLRCQKTFTLPRGWTIHISENINDEISRLNLPYPVVAKPIRGRGSHGVKVCHSQSELLSHVSFLFAESPTIMIEEYLSGEEATITVMPPSSSHPNYWALPIVTRFNHESGIAPYNGTVAVTANSRVISSEKYAADARYGEAARECEAVAGLLNVTAPIRIDVRRFLSQPGSKFALFDVNMKPVSICLRIKELADRICRI
jgi:carbamoylphosphate synthase large subunit